MKFLESAAVLAATFNAVSAIDFEPPQIKSFVSSALSQYSAYVHYTPPPSASTAVPARVKVAVNAASTETAAAAASTSCFFWMNQIKHQGIAAFNSNPSTYKVFRNVKDFGAKGDGKTDDTAAIQSAIDSGGRCLPGSCASSTVTPAVVFFPPGTYVVSSSIVIAYYTQLIGNPNCMPVIKPKSTYRPSPGAVGILEGDPYGADGLKFGATNIFWRQIRNFILDMTDIPASSAVTGIHWPTGQATSIQNVIFKMSKAPNTQHQAMFIESGSGGYMNDLIIEGGLIGLNIGSQQFTVRNVTVTDAVTAISQLYSWSWLYQNIKVDNCSVALDLTSGGTDKQSVGSVTLIDSTISNTPIGIKTAYTSKSKPLAAGSLIVENVDFENVPTAISGPNGPVVKSVSRIAAFGQGNKYTPSGPQKFQGTIGGNSPRPASLVRSDGRYYARSKPQYEGIPASSFISARTQGATGNGKTDDTKALQNAINLAKSQGKVLFVDQGDYVVTSTIYIPAGSRIVGESFSVILSSGSFFNNMASPQPVVQIGKPGEAGSIEWSDMIVSTRGAQAGAILIQYNLVAPAGNPAGLWDVHTRVGGFTGSELTLLQCPVTANKVVTASNLNKNCIAAYLNMHITKGSAGLYLENVWLWTADHDVDDPNLTQITVYSGRGLLDESTSGPIWMVGTSVEHHVKYQYQFSNTKNVFAGFIQTETAYYQPNPPAPGPFPYSASYTDPKFPTQSVTVGGTKIPAADGWGLRILNSDQVLIYGAGHYSFFNNNNVTCSDQGAGAICQNDIVSVEGNNGHVSIYTLATVGSHYQITQDSKEVALFSDNFNNFTAVIARFVI